MKWTTGMVVACGLGLVVFVFVIVYDILAVAANS